MKEEKIIFAGLFIGSTAGLITAAICPLFMAATQAACLGTAAISGGALLGVALAGEIFKLTTAAQKNMQ